MYFMGNNSGRMQSKWWRARVHMRIFNIIIHLKKKKKILLKKKYPLRNTIPTMAKLTYWPEKYANPVYQEGHHIRKLK